MVALFVALGGTAVATLGRNSVGPRQIRPGAVTTSKIRNGAVTGPKVKLSTLGVVPHAAVAETASPLAYARVEFTGSVNLAFSKNITQANVSHPAAGVYCLNLPFAVRTGQVVAESDSEPDDIATLEIVGANGSASLSGCPGTDDVEVRTFDTETNAGSNSGPQDSDFYIELSG